MKLQKAMFRFNGNDVFCSPANPLPQQVKTDYDRGAELSRCTRTYFRGNT